MAFEGAASDVLAFLRSSNESPLDAGAEALARPFAFVALGTGADDDAPGGGVPAALDVWLGSVSFGRLASSFTVAVLVALLVRFLDLSSAVKSSGSAKDGKGGNSESTLENGRAAVGTVDVALRFGADVSRDIGTDVGATTGAGCESLSVWLSAGEGHSGSGGKFFSFSSSRGAGVYPPVLDFELALDRNFCRNARIAAQAGWTSRSRVRV